MILSCAAPLVVIGIIYAGGSYTAMQDELVINGQVTSKERDEVSCSHSYKCHCRQVPYTYRDSKGKTHHSTKEKCDTCYDHPYDVDWLVHSNIDDTSRISRIDRQGINEPPRWTAVNVGDPYSKTQSYSNYVKASPNSIFNLGKYKNGELNLVPEYPIDIYDYYKINRVLAVSASIPNLPEWNNKLSEVNKVLGPKKQANVVVVFTSKPLDFAYTIRDKWLGGKKNDILLVIGTKAYPKVDWVQSFSWTKHAMVDIKLRNDISDLGTLENVDYIMKIINDDVTAHYVRKPMKEFEYLKNAIEPSTTVIVWALIMGILVSLGTTWWCIRNDVFGDESRRW